MKLYFQVREPASFFHILDSLSRWDIHTRISVKEYYCKRFGLNKKEKELIKDYIGIRKRHPWSYLDSDFYLSGDFTELRRRLIKRLNREEFIILEKIVNHFYDNIHLIYSEQRDNLEKWKIKLEKASVKYKASQILYKISRFYKAKNCPRKIYVHLVIDPSGHFCGGANIFPKEHITLEVSDLDGKSIKELKQIISVALHESLHLIEFKSEKKWKNFESKARKEGVDFNILREAIADTIVPGGVLAEQHNLGSNNFSNFGEIEIPDESNRSEYYYKSRSKLSALLYPFTKKQFKEGKNIFEGNYILDCINKFKEMRKQ